MDEQQITRFIVETVRQYGFVLGSQLGARVKKEFPWFQGLKHYIDEYCADQIVRVREHGPDFVYAHISQIGQPGQPPLRHVTAPAPVTQETSASTAPTTLPSGQPPAETAPPSSPIRQKGDFIRPPLSLARATTLWTAFTNPTLNDRLAVDNKTPELRVVPGGSRLQPPLIEVPKVTTEEHRRIATDFAAQVEPTDRPHLQQIAGAPEPWPMWSWHIRNYARGKYMVAWLNFRTEALRKLLEGRLAQLGCDGPTIETLVKNLLETKHRRASQPEQPAPLRGHGNKWARISNTENQLRRMALDAISQMSADELRRLWLPLGAIVNYMRGDER